MACGHSPFTAQQGGCHARSRARCQSSSAPQAALMPIPGQPAVSGVPPMGASPMATPTGNPGQAADGMAGIREAIKILQDNLTKLPIGSEPYKSVLSAIQGISKHVPPSNEVPGVQRTALRDLQQNSQKNAMMEAVMRSMGAPGGAPGGGGAAGGAAAPQGAPVAPGGAV